MKYIISGTNRPGSRTLEVSKLIQKIYADLGEQVEIIDLRDVGLGDLSDAIMYGDAPVPTPLAKALEKISQADGLIVVTPEYNGSMPGALKYFIDHWKYPESFEFRPICLVGLGGRFGGLRPVEHLQGVFGYRNSFIYPERVFLTDVFKVLVNGEITSQPMSELLLSQAKGFRAFCHALSSHGLDANARLAKK